MAKTKKGCLGCSPLVIIFGVLLLSLVFIGVIAGPLGRAALPGLHLPSWLSIKLPEPELPATEVFNVFGFGVTNTLIATWITMIVVIGFAFAATRKAKIIPSGIQSVFEAILEWVYNLCTSVADEERGRKFFPLVATLFLFVGFNAWLGLLPGYGSITIITAHGHSELIRAANTDINTPLAIALITFFTVWITGFAKFGIGYMSQFLNFKQMFHGFGLLFKGKIGAGAMDIVAGIINALAGFLELLGQFIRIISLTFRLFGNMTAGEILLLMISFIFSMLVPIIFYGLEILVGFIQALVFSGLTLIYLTLATTPHGGEEHH
jgi:F-type H+-transporting ATPase subunit a